jgi:ppGpp synthetase/RelA/SpoT-type nucleotidyltranferase
MEEINAIEKDFADNKCGIYKEIMEEFIDSYLRDVSKARIHSYRARVKDSEHLAVKIIRKKNENNKKYRALDSSNYEKFVTDIIGIRCFLLFKSDWVNFHNYIMSQFEDSEENYIKDCLTDFDDDRNHNYFAEGPKVHIRTGDSREVYEKVLRPDCVIDDKIYRSVHYIIKYQGVYIEIQVRTLFEEGWGEIDHAIVYPYHNDNLFFKEYTELLNRLSGLADEMGSFFIRLKENEEFSHKEPLEEVMTSGNDGRAVEVTEHREKDEAKNVSRENASTPKDYLGMVLQE